MADAAAAETGCAAATFAAKVVNQLAVNTDTDQRRRRIKVVKLRGKVGGLNRQVAKIKAKTQRKGAKGQRRKG